jgi:uncharacterized repeat protein (TIGR03803 family)
MDASGDLFGTTSSGGPAGGGTVYELTSALSSPSVVTQPASQNTSPGQTVAFTAAATGNPTPTVQWQLSTDGGATFADIAGATSTTYSFIVAAGESGYEYRAVFINTQGSATTLAATLTLNAGSSVTIFGNTAPALQNVNDPSIPTSGGVEVGLKFDSDVAGTVSAIRFFKGSLDTGTQTGSLWTAGGTLLATATFTNETASGWQTVNLSSPVTLSPGATYIVSYHTNAPYIAYTPQALASGGIDNGPLHVLANGVAGNNGVYAYGASAFPANYNGQAPNYWVDVVFNPQPTTNFSDVLGINAPAASLQNVNDPGITSNGGVELGARFSSDVNGTLSGIRFYKGSLDTGTHTGEVWDTAGNLLATATFANETASGWQQVSFSSPVTIQANAIYTISYHTTAQYIAYTPNGLQSAISNGPLHLLANGVYQYGSLGFPTSNNGQAPNYWVDVLFNTSATPGNVLGNSSPAAGLQNVNDPGISSNGGVELGAKFTSDVSGLVSGIRFFKGSLDTGSHTGEIWDNAGNLLASATFINESASGWQQVTFSSPVAIQAGVTYIISYHTTSPYIAYTPSGLTNTISNGPLHLLASGVYRYGSTAFPNTSNGQAPNYWVDVIFQ